jgi:hypothetical protein
MTMNSVSLVTARADHNQLAVAVKRATDTGGRVLVVPSPQPPAPGPFDFPRSTARQSRLSADNPVVDKRSPAGEQELRFASLPVDNSFAPCTSPMLSRPPSLNGAA